MNRLAWALLGVVVLAACGPDRRARDRDEDVVDAGDPAGDGGASDADGGIDGGGSGDGGSGDGGHCVRRTCAAAGATCGAIADGCGGSLDCGSCSLPDTCGGGGIENRCGRPPCGLEWCGAECVDTQNDPAHCGGCFVACQRGSCSDGHCSCATQGSAVGCPSGSVCDVWDRGQLVCLPKCDPSSSISCGAEDVCTPVVDASRRYDGIWDCYPRGPGANPGSPCTEDDPATCRNDSVCARGTTGTFICQKLCDTRRSNTCATGETCHALNVAGLGACLRGTPCTPQTCSSASRECGSMPDGCGRTLTCGSCAAPLTCGGGGTEGRCGCTNETDEQFCARAGKTCGTATGPDNCGDERRVDCGICTVASTVVAPELGGGKDGQLLWDAQGNPHVIYVDATDEWLRHAWRVNGVWQREVVDRDSDRTKHRVWAGRAVIAADGTIHVTYARTTQQSPYTTEHRFASRSGSAWQLGRPSPGAITDLKIESTGTLVAVLARPKSGSGGPFDLVQKRFANGAWTERVVTTFGSSWSSSPGGALLFVDAQDRSWIAFWESSGAVQVAQPTATGWAPPAQTPLSYEPRDFLVDASGIVHLRSRYVSEKYYFGSGLFWTEEAVTGRKLALDSQRRLVALGFDIGSRYGSWGTYYKTFTVWAKRRDGTAWTETMRDAYAPDVDISSSDAWEPAFAGLDPADRPVFLQATKSGHVGIELVQFPPNATQVRDAVDLKPTVSAPTSIAVGADGRTRIAYVGSDGAPGPTRLFIATEQPGGTWARKAVELPPNANPGGPTLFVAADGSEHVVFVAQDTGGAAVFHATPDAGGTWRATSTRAGSTINGPWVPALDASKKVHFAFCDRDNAIHYAAPSGSTWTTSLVLAGSWGSSCPLDALVVDPQGRPFITHHDGAYIKLAQHQAGFWPSAQVAYDGNFYGHALTLDAAGRPCLVHTPTASSGYAVTLTCLDGGVFATEQVFAQPRRIQGVARDAAGGLHLFAYPASAWDSNASNLVHLFRTPGGWQEETIGDVKSPKVAVTPAGRPRLVFYDEQEKRVRYVTIP